MSVVDQDALVASATTVLEKVRERYWREGSRKVDPQGVTQAIREFRIGAGCTERNLPAELTTLLDEIRTKHEPIGLARLMIPLLNISSDVTKEAS